MDGDEIVYCPEMKALPALVKQIEEFPIPLELTRFGAVGVGVVVEGVETPMLCLALHTPAGRHLIGLLHMVTVGELLKLIEQKLIEAGERQRSNKGRPH